MMTGHPAVKPRQVRRRRGGRGSGCACRDNQTQIPPNTLLEFHVQQPLQIP